MVFLKQYWSFIAIGVLLLAIILLSYFAGDTFSKLKDLRKEKEEYLEVKKEQDSIIKIAKEEIIRISHERDSLIAEGIQINENANYDYKTNISKEKKDLHKKLNDVTSYSIREQLRIFSRESDQYSPY